MLSVIVIREFEDYFAGMVPLMEHITAESYLAQEKTSAYLKGLVERSEKYNLPFASDIALIRGRIHTYVPEEGDRPNTGNGRKKKHRFFIDCLTQAKACAEEEFAKTRKLLEESSVLLRKLSAVAERKGIFQGTVIDLESVMEAMKKDAELMPALTSAIGTVGLINTKYLLKEAIEEVLQE